MKICLYFTFLPLFKKKMVDQMAAGSLAHLLKKQKDVPGTDIVQVSMNVEPPEKICGAYYESKRENERLRYIF